MPDPQTKPREHAAQLKNRDVLQWVKTNRDRRYVPTDLLRAMKLHTAYDTTERSDLPTFNTAAAQGDYGDDWSPTEQLTEHVSDHESADIVSILQQEELPTAE